MVQLHRKTGAVRGWARHLAGLLALITVAPCMAGETVPPGPLISLQGPDNRLHATIAPEAGAEMVGLEYRYKGRWIELLYRGRNFSKTDDWDGKAPILWPATGRNFARDPVSGADAPGWISQGVFYPMKIHGFARDLSWQVEGKPGSSTVTLRLRDTAETRKSYPFGFTLTTTYTVGRNTLTIHQLVRASAENRAAMPFSIGNHMTYNLPLVPSSAAAESTFQTGATKRIVLADNRPTGKTMPFSAVTPTPVTTIGTRKAVSLGDFPGDRASVTLRDPSGLSLTVSHHESLRPSGTPVLFNLWGDPEKGFFSPEPWVGKQNSLATMDGAIALRPGEMFGWDIVVTLR
jgi:galactose mutarotase-like enzyme